MRMKTRKNRTKGGMMPVGKLAFNPFANKPPMPPASSSATESSATESSATVDENSIRKWFTDYKEEYDEIYNTYFKKPPLAMSTLPKKIKEALIKKNAEFEDPDGVSQKLADEIKTALQAKKTAEDIEAASQPLDDELVEKLNTQYLKLQRGDLDDGQKEFVLSSTLLSAKVNNKILQKRYIEAAKIYQSKKPVEEDVVVDFSQQKFEILFRIVNCNPKCLGGEKEISILADGLVSYQKKQVDINKEILKIPAPTEKTALESHNMMIASAEKFIADQEKNPLEFTPDEVKAFIAGMKNGTVQQKYPQITSQCDEKAESSSSKTETTENPTKSKEEKRGEIEKKSQEFLDGTSRSTEQMQDLVKVFKYSNLRDVYSSLVLKRDDKTDRSKEKEFLINLMRKKYFEEKQTELIELVAILNKTENLTKFDQIAQTSGKKLFNDLREKMTEKAFLDDLKSVESSAEIHLQITEAQKKKKEIETQKIEAIETNRKLKLKNKKEYLEGFLERNKGEAAEEFIADINKRGLKATKTEGFDFDTMFPNENKTEF